MMNKNDFNVGDVVTTPAGQALRVESIFWQEGKGEHTGDLEMIEIELSDGKLYDPSQVNHIKLDRPGRSPGVEFSNRVDSSEVGDFLNRVADTLDRIQAMLISKNRAYGNSALEPVRIFSKSDETEGIRVRIDDKLSRIAKGSEMGEDVLMDLIGYLVLLKIAEDSGSV